MPHKYIKYFLLVLHLWEINLYITKSPFLFFLFFIINFHGSCMHVREWFILYPLSMINYLFKNKIITHGILGVTFGVKNPLCWGPRTIHTAVHCTRWLSRSLIVQRNASIRRFNNIIYHSNYRWIRIAESAHWFPHNSSLVTQITNFWGSRWLHT